MAETTFCFRYHPRDGEHVLDAYDASQALYGIARSLSILTHYTINQTVIKQAPALRGARILIEPPREGSFEFIVPIISMVDPSTAVGTIALGLGAAYLHDLLGVIFRRLSGQADKPSTDELNRQMRSTRGDIDALSDAVEEDIIRIQRPIVNNVTTINISGGSHNIINLNQETYDFAKTKVLGDGQDYYDGHVTSFNGSTISGRFWIDSEDRTVGFSVDRNHKLPATERVLLAESLSAWVNMEGGNIKIRGTPLTSKQGLLKQIFITKVSR